MSFFLVQMYKFFCQVSWIKGYFDENINQKFQNKPCVVSTLGLEKRCETTKLPVLDQP